MGRGPGEWGHIAGWDIIRSQHHSARSFFPMSTIRDIRQAAILNAARDLFSRQGFHKTTMPEIADAAGTSVGLIYYHFKNKADILVAIVKEFHDSGLTALTGPQD